MLGDILIPPGTPCLAQLIEVYEQYRGSVLSLVPLPPEVIPSYGIATVEAIDSEVLKITHLVEKPPLEEAPSDLGVYGRYVLTPESFALLEKTPPARCGDIHVTDAAEIQARAGHWYDVIFPGEGYETG